jgi:vacuolar-type H+-ATPase subunit E/Vma4
MPLADILSAMQADADAEINRTRVENETAIAQIRAEAEHAARGIRERHRHDLVIPLRQERARQLNRARLAALRAANRAREELLTQALGCARERLAQLRGRPDYAAVLRRLAEEAMSQLDGTVILHADPRDRELLHTLLPEVPIEFDLETWGGIEACTEDGRIRAVNTLEARLGQARDELRQAVMPLFSFPSRA